MKKEGQDCSHDILVSMVLLSEFFTCNILYAPELEKRLLCKINSNFKSPITCFMLLSLKAPKNNPMVYNFCIENYAKHFD